MTTAPSDVDLAAYVDVMRRLLAHGGYERTGRAVEAKKWDVEHIVAYLEANGRPDRRNAVHVAGSKGKGSVSTITEAILREAITAEGGHTLLITSPDLHTARERIAIDGRPIDHATFTRLANRVLDNPTAERNPASAHVFIINPLHGGAVDGLFTTHPKTANRIAALRAMAGATARGPWG